MFCEYIRAALSRATYEIIEDEEPFYGEISQLARCLGLRKDPERMPRKFYKPLSKVGSL
jgi:hypothetical protein